MKIARLQHIQRKLGLITLLLLWGPVAAQGANHYVLAGASGNGSGADWSNAYATLPSTLVRGDVYYIGVGNYPGYTFNSPDSGTMTIEIRSATAADHGTDTGWNSGFAGQALFAPSSASTDYWKFNGQTRGSSWETGYNLKFWNQSDPQGDAFVVSAASNVTFDYVEIEGTNQNYTSTTPCGSGGYCDGGIYVLSPSNNLYVGHTFLHDVGDTQIQANSNTVGNSVGSNWTFEYDYFSRDHTGAQSADNHSEAFSVTAQNLIVRFNYFQDIGSSGVLTDASAGTPNVGPWYVYGNVVFWTNLNPFPGIGDGFVCFFGENATGPINVYNNTIANINGPGCSICNMNLVYTIGGDNGTPTVNVYNNLIWNVAGGNPYIPTSGWTFNADYNTVYSSPNFNNAGAHSQNISSGNPFLSFTGVGPLNPFLNFNFQLTGDTAAGMTFSSPYNLDMNGTLRGQDGVWDRGAFQVAGTNSSLPNPPTNLRATVQ